MERRFEPDKSRCGAKPAHIPSSAECPGTVPLTVFTPYLAEIQSIERERMDEEGLRRVRYDPETCLAPSAHTSTADVPGVRLKCRQKGRFFVCRCPERWVEPINVRHFCLSKFPVYRRDYPFSGARPFREFGSSMYSMELVNAFDQTFSGIQRHHSIFSGRSALRDLESHAGLRRPVESVLGAGVTSVS